MIISRRLGLSSTADCVERRAVITKYADLAKTASLHLSALLLDLTDGSDIRNSQSWNIYPGRRERPDILCERESDHDRSSSNPELTFQELEPLSIPTHKACCGHALLFLDEKVTAVADLSTDWRFAKNDVKGDTKVS
jgi:hypothetical protein